MMGEDKKINCYYQLRVKLEEATKKKFPACLENIDYDEKLNIDIDDLKEKYKCNCEKSENIHSHCLCGVLIHKPNIFINTINNDEIIIGSTCIDNLIDDINNYMENKEEFNELYNRWIGIKKKIKFILKSKKDKCIKCDKKWFEPRCFINGLCAECRFNKSKLDNIICVLPKFKNKSFKEIIKLNPSYIKFCIEKKTRHWEEFKEYLTYF